jgi:hypothetical protein
MKSRFAKSETEDIKTITDIIFDVWESHPTEERENLSASISARIQAVIDAGGGETDF